MRKKVSYNIKLYSVVDSTVTEIRYKTLKELTVGIKKYILDRTNSFDVYVEKLYFVGWYEKELWYYNHITDGVSRYNQTNKELVKRIERLRKLMISFNR